MERAEFRLITYVCIQEREGEIESERIFRDVREIMEISLRGEVCMVIWELKLANTGCGLWICVTGVME